MTYDKMIIIGKCDGCGKHCDKLNSFRGYYYWKPCVMVERKKYGWDKILPKIKGE